MAIFSYDGGLYFGVTGDYEGAPDIDVLTTGIERGMDDLLALARPPRPAAKPGARGRPNGRARRKPSGVAPARREVGRAAEIPA